MNCQPILNRDFQLPADGWVHVVPKGEFPVRGRRNVTQVVDDQAISALAQSFQNAARSPGFGGVLVDFDHFSYDQDKASEAAGWIIDTQAREDGLWANVRWTDLGAEALTNGRYRFASPVWLERDTEDLGKGRVRPLRLDSVGLTNAPNMRGGIPLSNRGNPPSSEDMGGAPPNKPAEQTNMKRIATLVGLSADASEESVLGEIQTLMNRAADAQKQAGTLTVRITDLETQNQALLETQVETDLEKFSNRFKPESRDKLKAALLKNRASTLELLEGMAPIAEPKKEPVKKGDQAVLNRADGQPPKSAAGATEGTDQAKAREASELARSYALTNRCTFDEAHNAIRRQRPELFGIE